MSVEREAYEVELHGPDHCECGAIATHPHPCNDDGGDVPLEFCEDCYSVEEASLEMSAAAAFVAYDDEDDAIELVNFDDVQIDTDGACYARELDGE